MENLLLLFLSFLFLVLGVYLFLAGIKNWQHSILKPRGILGKFMEMGLGVRGMQLYRIFAGTMTILVSIFFLVLANPMKIKLHNRSSGKDSKKTLATTLKVGSKTDYIFLVDPDCDEQIKSIQQEQKVKVIFFDVKGLTDEKTVHNGKLAKKTLVQDSEFKEMAGNNFDFISVSQECKIGKELAKKYKVVKFPAAMLLDKNNKEIFQVRVINHISEIMMEEDQTGATADIDLLKRLTKVKLKRIVKNEEKKARRE